MEYPLIIAFELSSSDENAFPLAVAWTLPEGTIKTTLIQPEDGWLEEANDLYLDIDCDRLYQYGHSAKAILEELQLDRGDEPLYSPTHHDTEQALDRLYETVGGDNDLPLRPLAELLSDCDPDDVEHQLQESRVMLDLDLYTAEGQVRAWLDVCHHLL